ncbi:MAG: dephospho-CoA kinase [Clostridiaceae bacterium]
MLRIGLTGGIGSGKSTVSGYLKELGFKVIDADVVAREVMAIYPKIHEYINREFGKSFFDGEGRLDRKKLGSFLFANKEKLAGYEAVILPLIKKEIFIRMDELEKNGVSVCFLDAPTLIEQGMHKQMDKNILIWVDRETQIRRISKRDSMEHKQIMERISSQLDLDEKRKYADFIVDNTSGFEETKKQVHSILSELKIVKGAI